ncbi:MAG TPA: DMT family transporter [Bacteroidales bacterium]|nr:DMT family transporter [Bacteroidales bacterium]
MKKSRQAYLYAGLAILFWSTVPTAFKKGLQELEIIPMLTIASLTSSIILFIILIASGKISLLLKKDTKGLTISAILGFINPFAYYLILLKAYQLLPAQIAQPLNMVWPLIFVFLSVIFLGKKIRKNSFIALLISFTGVFIISSRGNFFNYGQSDIRGVALALTSSLFFAFYFIMNMKDGRDETLKLFLNFLFGSIYLVIALLMTEGWDFSGYSIPGITASVYTGLFEMGITFLLWLKALNSSENTDKTSNLVYLAPFLSLVFVHFILHEPIYYTTPLGLILIVTGILIQNRKTQR